MNENLSGLSAREVEERRARGEGGTGAAKITKTKPQIVRENLCTLFNFLNFLIAVLLFLVGAYSNMLFIAIIILNIVIGSVIVTAGLAVGILAIVSGAVLLKRKSEITF